MMNITIVQIMIYISFYSNIPQGETKLLNCRNIPHSQPAHFRIVRNVSSTKCRYVRVVQI